MSRNEKTQSKKRTPATEWKLRDSQPKALQIDQKPGRNSNSNLLRMFFRRLEHRLIKCPEIILNIIMKHKLDISLEEFQAWVKINRVDFRNYVRITSVRKLFIDQPFGRGQAKIMRIMLKDFLEKEALVCFITSKKIQRGAVNYSLTYRRTLIEEIRDEL